VIDNKVSVLRLANPIKEKVLEMFHTESLEDTWKAWKTHGSFQEHL
jgi:hypothetical protein